MLAGRLQRRTTTLATRMEDAFRVRLHLPSAPGSGAALCQELRASSRRSHRPTGQPKRQERTQNWIKLGGTVSGHDPWIPLSSLVHYWCPLPNVRSEAESSRSSETPPRRLKCLFLIQN